MNKKGFTLAELLGVIVILVIISILALPPLLEGIRSNKNKLSSATEKIIFSATDLYLSNNSNAYPRYNGSIYCVVLNELVESGDLLSDLKDVNTNSNVDMTKIVKIEVNNNNYVKEIVESNECDRYINFDYNPNLSAVEGSSIPRCITDNFTCSLSDMKSGLPVMVNVDGTNEYKFYIINDNNGLLTLISSSNYGNTITYTNGSSNENGPDMAMMNLPTTWINTINQEEVIDNEIIIDYSGYSARLPMASEIAKLSNINDWNQTVVNVVPSFLKENIGSGYWTSTSNSTNKAWVLVNTLNNSGVSNSYKVRPVINIYKSSIGIGPSIVVKNDDDIEIINGANNPLASTYFNISSNGASGISNISCMSNIDGNVINTNQLSTGTHNITCTATSLSGLTNSETKEIKVHQKEYTFDYTGDSQTFNVPVSGTYKVELWGAQGGTFNSIYHGGYGSYVSGKISLSCTTDLYLYVGASGDNINGLSSPILYEYNGGGGAFPQNSTERSSASSGGGATDLRLINSEWDDFESLNSRIIIAAGGGGGDGHTDIESLESGYHGIGGSGGGLIGHSGTCGLHEERIGHGGTQVSPGINYNSELCNGNYGLCGSTLISNSGGGGGGYYGGAKGDGYRAGGGGGSSFISGHNGCDAISESSTVDNIIHTGQPNHYSGKVFTDTNMIDGAGYRWTNVIDEQEQMPNPNGGYYDLGVGHSGNGFAKITLISID